MDNQEIEAPPQKKVRLIPNFRTVGRLRHSNPSMSGRELFDISRVVQAWQTKSQRNLERAQKAEEETYEAYEEARVDVLRGDEIIKAGAEIIAMSKKQNRSYIALRPKDL